MKTPRGTEVDLGPGHIVFDGVPAPAKGSQQFRLSSAHVYCGHVRPSQLLLSSCLHSAAVACRLLRSPEVFRRTEIPDTMLQQLP